MPKSADLDSAYGRSILILTPQRALKFTATTQDRHNMWMTALAFLAQAGRLPAQLPQAAPARPPPPIPSLENLPKRSRSPSFGRATIRDSVRLAKGRRPSFHQSSSAHAAIGSDASEMGGGQDTGADFPAVPRLYISTVKHQRKRSNTSPRLPPPLNNLRSFSSSAIQSSTSSRLHPSSTRGSSIRTDRRSSSSKSGSVENSIASPDRPNFFEAVGTVRMEAFVDPNVRDGVLYLPAPPPGTAHPFPHHPPPMPRPRRKRGDSNVSISTAEKKRSGYVFDEDGMDPFENF
jgi:hypothetical protein